MDQIYFTADLHFGHPNILKHSPKRPYSDIAPTGPPDWTGRREKACF